MDITDKIEELKQKGDFCFQDRDGNHCFLSIRKPSEEDGDDGYISLDICKGECVTTEKGLKIWDIVEVFVYDMDGNQIDHWVD